MSKASSVCCALILLFVIAFGLTSCETAETEKRELSADECLYTLNYVLNLATDRAIPALFSDFNSFKISMVPFQYDFLNTLRPSIPGMDRLLHLWEEDVSTYIMPYFDEVYIYLETMVQDYQFQNPVELIESGIASISEDIRKNRENEMAEVIRYRLTGLNTEPWRNVAIHYNAWASSRENLYGEKNPRINVGITDDALITLLSHHLVDIYIRTLAFYEKLIRTTPDPTMDSVVTRVLGLE